MHGSGINVTQDYAVDPIQLGQESIGLDVSY
jgi:hypothetical protein